MATTRQQGARSAGTKRPKEPKHTPEYEAKMALLAKEKERRALIRLAMGPNEGAIRKVFEILDPKTVGVTMTLPLPVDTEEKREELMEAFNAIGDFAVLVRRIEGSDRFYIVSMSRIVELGSFGRHDQYPEIIEGRLQTWYEPYCRATFLVDTALIETV